MRLTSPLDDLKSAHPSRPLPWLPWAASGLFILGIVALVGTLISVMTMGSDSTASIRVLDAETDTPLANAAVMIGDTGYRTDADGYVAVPSATGELPISVAHEGYVGREGSVTLAGDTRMSLALRPNSEPAAESAETAGENTVAMSQQSDQVDAASTPAATQDPTAEATPTQSPLVASPSTVAASGELTGRITDANGEPVQGAMLTDGQSYEVTGADGLFAVQAQDFASDTLRVSAPGYADTTLSFASGGEPVELALELQLIKAIYYNPNISNTEEDVARLIEIINTTEVNAVVIDVKEELIFYDTQVQFFRDVDIVSPIIDLSATLARFQEHNIYTIARHVVFKDSLIAERRPELAVMNGVTGEVWRDMNGVAWVNPMLHDLWDPNIELAVELAELGFDEIQYDYVRFPTDGDISTMEFGLPNNEENRVQSIAKLLDWTREALRPTGAKLSADVFGYTMLVSDDLGIGQDITELAPHVDYLSPMVYPSHFPDGSLAVDGHPNDFPYETIEISMSVGADQLGSARQLRPWLQDFDFWGMMEYGADEVRAQIDAAEATGTSGWMLWDPNNWFTVEALGPDDGNMSRFERPSAVLPNSASRTILTRHAAALGSQQRPSCFPPPSTHNR